MESIGLADMAFVEVPHPMGMVSLQEIRAKADQAFPEILRMATQWKPFRTEIPGLGKPPYPAERIKFKGTYESLNKMYYEKKWSLGLPIIHSRCCVGNVKRHDPQTGRCGLGRSAAHGPINGGTRRHSGSDGRVQTGTYASHVGHYKSRQQPGL
jgi:hypothetical protein